MAFFLETLLGGLMAGMLYSLVALGFVLIFKASGVFNFAQGAMVLFGALAMARFSEWIPQWTGINSLVFANVVAFIIAGVVMEVFQLIRRIFDLAGIIGAALFVLAPHVAIVRKRVAHLVSGYRRDDREDDPED